MKARITSCIAVGAFLFSTSAQADGWRYPSEIPGLGDISIDPLTIGGRIARNRRYTFGRDFSVGRLAKVGGSEKSYLGDNEPLVGDFNGDGRDDIGVRWLGGTHEGKWTVSRNDGTGHFHAGKGVKFGGSLLAYKGDNRAFVGDFNGDGFDDIGVHWMSGPHEGKWTISMNDKAGNFGVGKGVKFGGATLAYVGDNEPVVGDFDGDGLDDIGVRWLSGTHRGQWWFSRNDGKGGFEVGTRASFAGKTSAYRGANRPVIGDFNGDGFDDIAVNWTDGIHDGKWTVSLNDGDGGRSFSPGRAATFSGTSPSNLAYEGDNQPFTGDFNGDGFADVGVHWTGAAHTGRWFISKNARRDRITSTPDMAVHVPMLFINFKGGVKTTESQAEAMVLEVERYFLHTSHSGLKLDIRYKIVELDQAANWAGGIPTPTYGADGKLINPGAYPAVTAYSGYECRFQMPDGSRQIIFKDANGDLDWTNNSNIHRNYCQVAERNYGGDALRKLASEDPTGYEDLMTWASADDGGPTVYFTAPELVGGGNRYFNSSWGGPAWPITVNGRQFVDYMYSKRGARVTSHELGHFIGHGSELYVAGDGSQCTSGTTAGYLGPYDVMGSQGTYYASLSALNRWRFGFAQARYLTPADKTVDVSLKRAMTNGEQRSLAVIQPDPKGHPDEVFLVENRGKVTAASKSYDSVDRPGIYIYHINSSGASNGAPLIELVSDPTQCPSSLKPYQGSYSPSSVPAAKFHDGSSANFSITNVKTVGSTLSFRVSFGAQARGRSRRRR